MGGFGGSVWTMGHGCERVRFQEIIGLYCAERYKAEKGSGQVGLGTVK